jgi:hypothetical protein
MNPFSICDLRLAVVSLAIATAIAMGEPISTRTSGEGMLLQRDPERNVTSVAGLTQELVSAALPTLHLIYGEGNLRVESPLPTPPRLMPIAFGAVSVGGAAKATLKDQRTTWASNSLIYDCAAADGGSATLQVVLSRLSPAVLLRAQADSLDLFVGVRPQDVPANAALAGDGGIAIRVGAAGPAPGACRWVLLWQGRSTQAMGAGDVPLLVVPFVPLKAIETMEGGGLRLRSQTAQMLVAVMPLRGIVRPDARETAAWTGGLPPAVAQKCDWWAARLGQFPIDVTEAYAYDAAEDRADVTWRFEYLKSADGPAIAPLPPMLALARQQGFGAAQGPLAMSVSAEPVDTGVATIFGPYVAIEGSQVTWSLKGLKRYVDWKRAVPTAPTAESRPFDEKLGAEVDRIIRAGVLAPWFYEDGLFHENLIQRQLYWANPAEHAYYMSEVADLLVAPQRDALVKHLLSYPQPHEVAHIPPQQGARREGRHVDRAFLDLKMWYEREPRKVPTLFNLYAVDRLNRLCGRRLEPKALAECGRIFAEAQKGRDWATMLWTNAQGDDYTGVVAANRNFAGLVGWARICREAGDTENLAVAMGQLAQSAALRYSMGKYRQWLYAIGRLRMPAQPDWQKERGRNWAYGHLVSFNVTRPEHDIEQVTELTAWQVRTGTYHPQGDWRVSMRPYQVPFLYMVPETAAFLGDFLRPETERYEQVLEAFQGAGAEVERPSAAADNAAATSQ